MRTPPDSPWRERLANVARASLVAGLVWMGMDIAGAQGVDAKALARVLDVLSR